MITWTATYTDNMKISKDYLNLDRVHLKQFMVFSNGKPKIRLDLDKDKVLFFRCRVWGVGSPRQIETCFAGWRRKLEGGKIELCLYVLDGDGKVTQLEGFSGQWSEPVWYGQEQI